MHHRLSSAHRGRVRAHNLKLMSHGCELVENLRLHSRFDNYVAASLGTDGEAGGLERFLNVHTVIHHVGNKLRVRYRLVRSSHDAEPDVQVPTLHERRNNCMEGPFS